MPLDWEDLRYFLAAYRSGSLSGAARSLETHASTVSRRMESLEASLDSVLFRRNSEGLTPTDAAQRVLEHALSAERQMQLIEQFASGETSRVQGRVRLSATTTFDEFFLSERVPLLLERYPKLVPVLASDSSLVDLVAGDADVALRINRSATEAPVPAAQLDDLRAARLGTVECHLYTSVSYLERHGLSTQSAVSEFDFIAPLHEWMPGSAWMHRHVSPERIRVEADFFGGCLQMLERGVGAAILPNFVAAKGRGLVRLDPLGVVDQRYLWCIWPTDLRRVARVQAVVQFITEQIRLSDLFADSDEPCPSADRTP